MLIGDSLEFLSNISVQAHLFPAVIFTFAVAIGIELTPGHFRSLLARPMVPILGTIVHTLTFPILAFCLVSGVLYLEVGLQEHLLLGIVLVAACPSGGFSNMLVLLARADIALSVLLTAVSSLLSFLTVPFFFWGFGQLIPQLSGEVELPVLETLISLLMMVVVPVAVGMVWRARFEGFVLPRIKLIQNVAQVFLYAVLVLLLVQDWENLSHSVGPALPWAIGLCVIALATGYGFSRLFGLTPVDCATVAIEGSIRNLAVAFLIATTVLDRVDIALFPSVYFMAVLIVGLSFSRFWRTRMAPKYGILRRLMGRRLMIRPESISSELCELPGQPPEVAWPTESWSRFNAEPADASRFNELTREIFELEGTQGVTYALLVFKGGQLRYERYDAGASPFYLQYSWSMAKSITQALAGILVQQGRLDLYAPVDVSEWQNDARAEITLDQLLRMSSGLSFQEDYVDGQASDVIPMLMFDGRHDTGAFAAAKELAHTPGSHWAYSSGTTNIICRILKDVVGGGASGMLKFMNDELFEPIGVRTATPKFDTSGTFIGSSFLMAIPQDFARFGLLYLRGGHWDGKQIIPREWVDYARTPTYQSEEECYGSHWWINPANTHQFYSSGYDGQRILLDPDRDVMVVRLGRTPIEEVDYVWDRVYELAAIA